MNTNSAPPFDDENPDRSHDPGLASSITTKRTLIVAGLAESAYQHPYPDHNPDAAEEARWLTKMRRRIQGLGGDLVPLRSGGFALLLGGRIRHFDAINDARRVLGG